MQRVNLIEFHITYQFFNIFHTSGQSVTPDISCQLAIEAAINYHRSQKGQNATVSECD